MAAAKSDDNNDLKGNKELVHQRCEPDGTLVSPIDLSLDISRSLQLEPLRWVNFDEPPVRMKLTNSGDTMVLSAKWENERPFLAGGPLDGNYVFSQVHFHWGSSEHEGSEHTVRGVCYPLEMHVVFFKTRYLTQAAALKQDDGIIIVAYLFKLQSRSSIGLQWLTSQLEHVVEPKTSAQVSPVPLSTLMLPFTSDYLTYWGALVSQSCRHPVMWLVSRAALAVTSDNLNLFRRLLNSKKESMTKNFRSTSPPQNRTVFHVNPSVETNQLLLPGAVDPPCQMVMVNFSQMAPLNEDMAKKIFSKGDSNELESDKKCNDAPRSHKPKVEIMGGSTNLDREGFRSKNTVSKKVLPQGKSQLKNTSKPLSIVTDDSGRERSLSSSSNRKIQGHTTLRKQYAAIKNKPEKGGVPKSGVQEQKGDCVHINASSSILMAMGESKKIENNDEIVSNENTTKKKEKENIKSRLPIPKTKHKPGNTGLKSCYASYFRRPESAPLEDKTGNAPRVKKPTTPFVPLGSIEPGNANRVVKPTTPTLKLENTEKLNRPCVTKPTTPTPESAEKRKVTTTIPRPSTRNGSKSEYYNSKILPPKPVNTFTKTIIQKQSIRH